VLDADFGRGRSASFIGNILPVAPLGDDFDRITDEAPLCWTTPGDVACLGVVVPGL